MLRFWGINTVILLIIIIITSILVDEKELQIYNDKNMLR